MNPICSVTSYSDSSEYGWGGYTVNISGLSAKGNFSEGEAQMDSTWRELKGTFNVLCSFVKIIKGRKVRHRTDNQNVVRALTNGSKKQHLQAVTMDIFNLCIENNIDVFPEWVPRSENGSADWISKDLDKDDYMLNPNIFAAADILWGPHTVDRLSLFETRQVPRFCSRWLNPCMEVLDAFSVEWSGKNNWLFPPPYLLPKVLRHLQWSSADGTLVVPWWKTARWWPLLILPDNRFRSEVIDFLVVEPKANMFIPGISMFSDQAPNFSLLLLRLCFCKGHK